MIRAAFEMTRAAFEMTSGPLVRTTRCLRNDGECFRNDVECFRNVHSLGQPSAFESTDSRLQTTRFHFESSAGRFESTGCQFKEDEPLFREHVASLASVPVALREQRGSWPCQRGLQCRHRRRQLFSVCACDVLELAGQHLVNRRPVPLREIVQHVLLIPRYPRPQLHEADRFGQHRRRLAERLRGSLAELQGLRWRPALRNALAQLRWRDVQRVESDDRLGHRIISPRSST
jgi:hypothetical protein